MTSAAYDRAEVTIVILAKDESRTVAEVVDASANWSDRIILMDGGSADDTGRIAQEHGAHVFEDDGRGKGSAIRQSLALVNTDFVVFMDADGSHDPRDIPRLIAALGAGADLCVGSRFAGGSDELSVSVSQLVRTVGNILMNIAINKRWHVELTDTLNGFRAVRLEAAVKVRLTEDTHTIEQEMVMKFLRHGFTVVNEPTHEYKRKFGEGHIRIWREWPKFVWCVVKNVAIADADPARVRARALTSSTRPK